jgi:hypothetical protein
MLTLAGKKRGKIVKGQCHEKVDEIRPWDSSLGTNYGPLIPMNF